MKRIGIGLALAAALTVLPGPAWTGHAVHHGFHASVPSGHVGIFISHGHPFVHHPFKAHPHFLHHPHFVQHRHLLRHGFHHPHFRSIFIGVHPVPHAVWVPGFWHWDGVRWVWVPGHSVW